MGTGHDYHDTLPGYSADALLHDGCAECEQRAGDTRSGHGIAMLDPQRFAHAWTRAAQYFREGLRDITTTEMPMLSALWAVQLQFERLGIPIGHIPARRLILAVDPANDDQQAAVLAAVFEAAASSHTPTPMPPPTRACRVCGCTNWTPCMTVLGPCAWSATSPDVCTSCDGSIAALDTARDSDRMRRLETVAKHARPVMNDLTEYGPSIVPHLLDTDQNDGEFLRQALAAL